MTYVLLGESGARRVPGDLWSAATQVARRYGWDPRGTIREPAWKGCYLTPAGQLVAARDAAAMALALEDALDDLPDASTSHAPPTSSDAVRGEPRRANLLERLGGQRKASVCELVGFLRGGAFMIYCVCARHGGEGDDPRWSPAAR